MKTYTVRPLVWNVNAATTLASEYVIHLRNAGESVFALVRSHWEQYGGYKTHELGTYKSLEECKAAAQRDHETRLAYSCLEPVPKETPREAQ